MSSFTDIDEVKLINAVSCHPILFDTADPNYRNVMRKEKVWKAIGKELHKKGDECKKKWKGIRDGYHRFKKRHPIGMETPKNCKDKRHVLLSFLDGLSTDKSGESNEPPTPESNVNDLLMVTLEEQELHAKDEVASEQEHVKDEVASFAEQDSDNEYLITKADVLTNPDNTNSASRKRAIKEENDSKACREKDEKRHASKKLKSNGKKKDDDVDLFVRHIGEVLRKLPRLEKAKAKKHLYLVLADYEIRATQNMSMRESSSGSDSTPPNSPGANARHLSTDPLYQHGHGLAQDDEEFD